MGINSSDKSCCPVFGSFCWKNPVHWFIALAILPFTIKGIHVAVNWFQGAVSAATGN